MIEVALTSRLQQAANDLFPRAEARGYHALDERDRTLFCVWLFCGEVDSGGFRQFFHDDSGSWAVETAQALERIGAEDAAGLLREGMALFPLRRVPADGGARRDALANLSAEARRALADLDGRFEPIGSDQVMTRMMQWYFAG